MCICIYSERERSNSLAPVGFPRLPPHSLSLRGTEMLAGGRADLHLIIPDQLSVSPEIKFWASCFPTWIYVHVLIGQA